MEQTYLQSSWASISASETAFYFASSSCQLSYPTLFYGVEIFGHCDTQDTQTLTVACNSIVHHVFNLRRTYQTSHLVNNILDLSLSQWIDLKTSIYFQKIVCTR